MTLFKRDKNPNKNMKRLERILIHKNKGTIMSAIIGQLFLTVVIIYALFNFKLAMLNSMFNFIDDSLTTSLLGGALVNIEEYGKSHQLIIYEDDVYSDVPGGAYWTNSSIPGSMYFTGWSQTEADILLSELNSGSDVWAGYSSLEHKKALNLNHRDGKDTVALGDNLGTNWQSDEYLRKSLSAFMQTFKYNTTNGVYGGKDTVDVIANLGQGGALQYSNGLYLTKSDLQKSILGSYIVSRGNVGIEITRFDIYNLYKANLAKKHVYQSEFFTVTGTHEATWKTCTSHGEEAYIDNGTLANFENAKAYFGITDKSPNYNAFKSRWEKDNSIYQAAAVAQTQSFICYTDTGVTYQGAYNPDKSGFYDPINKVAYLYSSEGTIWNNPSTALTSPDTIEAGTIAPLSGYSVYSYRSSNSKYGYTAGSDYKYNNYTSVTGSGAKTGITIQDGRMDGKEIKNTSLYAEITFDVDVMGSVWAEKVGLDRTVESTVARLIDIELKE